MSNLPALPVLRTLGGCGGTIVSKCLAAMEGTLLLSESNPRTAGMFNYLMNPLAMLRRHAPDDVPARFASCDAAALGQPHIYAEFIHALRAHLASSGRHLVVRDYGYVDFIGRPFVPQAPHHSSLDEALRGQLEFNEAYLVRHPLDQYVSLRRHRAVRKHVDLGMFLTGIVRAKEAYENAPVFRYEDFLHDPDTALKALTQRLGVPFDPNYRERLAKVSTMLTGDVRAIRENAIKPPKRKCKHWLTGLRCMRQPLYRTALTQLGYAN